MKISNIQSFYGIKNKNKYEHKVNNKIKNIDTRIPVTEKDIEYYDKLEQDAIRMNTAASVAIASAFLAGIIASGAIIYSAKNTNDCSEAAKIPEDIVDIEFEKIPSQHESEIWYTYNN